MEHETSNLPPSPEPVTARSGPPRRLVVSTVIGLIMIGSCITGALIWLSTSSSEPARRSGQLTPGLQRAEKFLDDAQALANLSSSDPAGALSQARDLVKQASELSGAAAPGSIKETADRIIAELNAESLTLVEVRNTAMETLLAAGGLDASTLTTLRAIEYRKTLVDRFTAACRSRQRFLEGSVTEFETRLRRAGVAESGVSDWVQGYRTGLQPDRVVAMAKLNVESGELMNKVLGVLGSHLGNWSADDNGNVTVTGSDGDSATRTCRDALARIQDIDQELVKHQDKFFEEARRAIKGASPGQR